MIGGSEAVDRRHGGDDDHVPTGEQGRGRRMSETVDLVVDGRFLLDVGVRLGDVRLGLVVVVVRDEVLDPVVGEELAELVRELGGQRLVRCQHEGRTLHALDRPSDRRRLARTRDSEQCLEPVAPLDSLGEEGDRLGLVPAR